MTTNTEPTYEPIPGAAIVILAVGTLNGAALTLLVQWLLR